MRVSLTLLGNFLQRNCYTFCSQIDEVHFYAFQRRFETFWDRKKVKISGTAYSQNIVAFRKGRLTVSMIPAVLLVGNEKKRECFLISMSYNRYENERKKVGN